MPSESENGQGELSEPEEPGHRLVEAVQQAVNDWVEEESIAVRREGEEVVAEEEELVKNISIMVALAVSEFDT